MFEGNQVRLQQQHIRTILYLYCTCIRGHTTATQWGNFRHYWVTDKWYRISILAKRLVQSHSPLYLFKHYQHSVNTKLFISRANSSLFKYFSMWIAIRHGNAHASFKMFPIQIICLVYCCASDSAHVVAMRVRVCSQQASHIAEAKFNKAHRGKTTVTIESDYSRAVY